VCFDSRMLMIDFVTPRIARGIRALTRRNAIPVPTTFGAASHTNRSTGGTLRKAAKRLFQEVSLVEDTADDIRYRRICCKSMAANGAAVVLC
jgi:hypothetical protein